MLTAGKVRESVRMDWETVGLGELNQATPVMESRFRGR